MIPGKCISHKVYYRSTNALTLIIDRCSEMSYIYIGI